MTFSFKVRYGFQLMCSSAILLSPMFALFQLENNMSLWYFYVHNFVRTEMNTNPSPVCYRH